MAGLEMAEWLEILELKATYFGVLSGAYSPAEARQAISDRRMMYPGTVENHQRVLDALEAWTFEIDEAIRIQNERLREFKREAFRLTNIDPDFPGNFGWDRERLVGPDNALDAIQTILKAIEEGFPEAPGSVDPDPDDPGDDSGETDDGDGLD